METENTTGKKKQRRSTRGGEGGDPGGIPPQRSYSPCIFPQHNIALSTLSKWLFNAKHKNKASAPVLFRELRVPQVPMAAGMGWAVEIVGPDGLVIRCREALSLHDVSWLLRGR